MHEVKDEIRFVDEALQPFMLNQQHLFLHLSHNSLAYSIYDPAAKKLNACCSYLNIIDQVHLDEIFSKDAWLNKEFELVKVMFSNPLFTFVPNSLFDEGHIVSYLDFNLIEADSFFQARNQMELLGAENLFCVKREPKIVVNKYHSNNRIFHSSTALIEGILREFGKTQGKKLFIFAWDERNVEIIFLDEGKLILYNYFYLSGDEELVYYPLYVCQQLHAKRKEVHAFIGGLPLAVQKLDSLLGSYFSTLDKMHLPSSFQFTEGLEEQTGSLAWSMSFLSICE